MTNANWGSITITVLALLLLAIQGCVSQISRDTDLVALEQQRYSAMVNADLETLDSVLDDNLIFTHASGKIDSKASFIASLSSGTLTYKSIDMDNVEVRLYDGCGIVTGQSVLDLNVRGEDRTLELLFTTFWVAERNGWKVVAYQSTHKP